MSIGAWLIGLAALILLVAYVAGPFRRGGRDLDAQIETWVAQVRRSEDVDRQNARTEDSFDASVERAAGSEAEPPVGNALHFCHQCGYRVKPEHRFCPNCGTQLNEN